MSDEQDAIDRDGSHRPDFATVARWEDNSAEVWMPIEQLGFRVYATIEGFSVQHEARQIGCYLLNHEGVFRWGWVETDTGRSDLHERAEYLAALKKYLTTTKGTRK